MDVGINSTCEQPVSIGGGRDTRAQFWYFLVLLAQVENVNAANSCGRR